MAEIEETVDDGSDCDDLVEEAYTYLVSKKYPECVSETKKRVIRRKAATLTISVEGELLYKHKQGKEKSLEERQKILLACHVDSTSGHMGKTRTLYRIKERFMWHGMVKDVVSLLSKCDVCQRMNRKLTTGVPELHPIPVKAPWYMVGIDFIGPLSPVAKDGSRYILTISDYFTKLLLLVLWQALILLKMIQIVTKEANLKTIHHPVIVPIKMTVLKSVALTVVALYWRIVQFLLNEIPFRNCPFTRKMKKQVVSGEWLTDDHMFYAQELLRMQFPTIDGWQSTLLAQNNGYLPAKMDAIQIHIVSDSHWVTSARLGGTVTLFDCRKMIREFELRNVRRSKLRDAARDGNLEDVITLLDEGTQIDATEWVRNIVVDVVFRHVMTIHGQFPNSSESDPLTKAVLGSTLNGLVNMPCCKQKQVDLLHGKHMYFFCVLTCLLM
eukprot:Em0027g25a